MFYNFPSPSQTQKDKNYSQYKLYTEFDRSTQDLITLLPWKADLQFLIRLSIYAYPQTPGECEHLIITGNFHAFELLLSSRSFPFFSFHAS